MHEKNMAGVVAMPQFATRAPAAAAPASNELLHAKPYAFCVSSTGCLKLNNCGNSSYNEDATAPKKADAVQQREIAL